MTTMATATDVSTDVTLARDTHMTKAHNENAMKTRQFNCAMNPDKQLDKVINDANLPNFSLEVNNSGFNVNIRCNSGTYLKVVKPSIQTLSAGFTGTVGTIM